MNIESIAKKFEIRGNFVDAKPFGSGHINDSFLATINNSGIEEKYVLQRINVNIFKNPDAMMENIVRVTEHIHNKLKAQNADDIDRKVLKVVSTKDGASCCRDESNGCWRMYLFIPGARTYDFLESSEQAFEAASAFGSFAQMLSDLPKPDLYEVIPNFHNGPWRMSNFQKALQKDSVNRAKEAKPEIEFLQKNGWIFEILPALVQKGQIPIRTTHNDTKINNVMLDNQTGKALAVLDLDLVMPGLSLYDFGDLVRTCTCAADEDERDLTKISMDISMFEAVLRGYLSTAGEFLNEAEKRNLILGGKMITLIMGTRFLTDYLEGDVYYKIHRPGQNLDRCRTQFKLVASMMEQEEKMLSLVEKL
jgi:hypothetical protein